jgi:hypothetical protein
MNNFIIRYAIFIIGIFLFQQVLTSILIALNFEFIAIIILVELGMAFLFALLYYPPGYRRIAWRDPRFHMNVAVFFGIFILIEFLFGRL